MLSQNQQNNLNPQQDRYQQYSRLAARQVKCEWFYSWIDRPYYAKNHLQEVTQAIGLGPNPALTHAEWSVIRSSLGRPRRFSKLFVEEQKRELAQYRQGFREIIRHMQQRD